MSMFPCSHHSQSYSIVWWSPSVVLFFWNSTFPDTAFCLFQSLPQVFPLTFFSRWFLCFPSSHPPSLTFLVLIQHCYYIYSVSLSVHPFYYITSSSPIRHDYIYIINYDYLFKYLFRYLIIYQSISCIDVCFLPLLGVRITLLIIRLVLSLSLSSGVTWRFHEKEILRASVSSFVSVVISAYIHCLITLAEFEGARITLRLYTYLLG